ncbi:hypothetical protein Rru_B0036 (plasmid) [Rhodospirillum rubrum ATCC 11170]|uniref:Uncharacterized protein n=1 Tax=Rhodospirillum rubrum (strain ATCC 11170 / ATH 1.1.1 / DSM 467 / LMG 4362 / NCIMB 8255 / S1) TaxID=269796 RepID=Q2RML3_RHORT|nr:hypothetical protein Rru_B0036 [Rhodospirillum rubrum ATCC 11170]
MPNEPRILHPVAQAALTARHLLPVLDAVEACLLAVRGDLDSQLRRLQPMKLGKSYPLGQCLEIAQAVHHRLRRLDEAGLSAEAITGLRALRAFQRAGGAFRQVWGDLRGEYFQNAFQVGTLYIDVANDTVTPTKPKVEILPFEAARFIPITDFRHFERIARRYWQGEIYPNHLLPTLAPHCPLIHVGPTGRIMLHDVTDYMLALTRAQGFAPSAAVLADTPMPLELFEPLRQILGAALAGPLRGMGHRLALSPEQGRRQALDACRHARAKRWHHAPQILAESVESAQRVNRCLAQAPRLPLALSPTPSPSPLSPPVKDTPMPTLRIDDRDYDLDSLSAEAKAHVAGIQFVDQELARLQAHATALQTARAAYVGALKAALPKTTKINGV